MKNSIVWYKVRPYVMIAPAMLGIFTFVIYPIIYLIYLSLFKYSLINRAKSKFIGLNNYIQILTREDFYRSLLNTVVYSVGVVTAIMLLSLLVAVWLKNNSKWNELVRAGMFTPHIISIVSISLVWLWLMEPSQGILNFILKSVGLPTSTWLQSSRTAMISIIIVSIWHSLGYYTLIVYAALQGLPKDIYEAAALDNAGRCRIFFQITLPLISPQLFFILIIMTIGSFKVFDTIQIMTGGGPNGATETLVYYIYSYRSTNIGYASATGVILMAIIGVFTIIYFKLLSQKVHYQ